MAKLPTSVTDARDFSIETESVCNATPNGNLPSFHGVQEPAPKEIRNELAFAVSLVKQLVVPTFVLDPQCKVLIWNTACERLTGVIGSDVVGTSGHWKAFYDAPRPCLADLVALDRASEAHQFYAHFNKVEETQRRLYAENWCVMPQVGTRLYLAIDAGPIYDDAGNLIAVVETLRDMTIQHEMQAELEQLANRDSLTGIANRRTFDKTLEAEWRRATRNPEPLTLLMLDVDYFKNYNDNFGHQAGDQCLRRIAEVLANSVQRASDLVARYGGEEFAIILPGVDAHGAQLVAQRICTLVEQLAIPLSPLGGAVITISIGSSSATVFANTGPSQLLCAADNALYEAKRSGRNRVVAVDLDKPAKT